MSMLCPNCNSKYTSFNGERGYCLDCGFQWSLENTLLVTKLSEIFDKIEIEKQGAINNEQN